MFDQWYDFHLIDRKRHKEGYLVCTWKYNFQSDHQRYIVEVELYQLNIFIVKYYAACHAKSKNRYKIILNEGHPGKTMRTCVNIMLHHYNENPLASFGFIGMNSCNKRRKGHRVKEDIANTQRFRIYQSLVSNFFGKDTFSHSKNNSYSAYLMINKKCNGVRKFKKEAEEMFKRIYFDFLMS